MNKNIQVFGDTVIFADEKGNKRSISVGDAVTVLVADRFSSEGMAHQTVIVAAISNGNDAGDAGDICYYYRNEYGEPAQDMVSPEEVIEIYRKARPGASPAGPGLSGNAPGANDRSAT